MSVVCSTVRGEEWRQSGRQGETKILALFSQSRSFSQQRQPTEDPDFLDCFVALIVDFDFDWDFFAVKVELWPKQGDIALMVGNGGIVRITFSPAALGVAQTSQIVHVNTLR